MMDLAASDKKKPVSLKSIAERHQLSEHYLEQLVAPLRNHGLVKSVRGAYGGYKLTKSPEEITVGDIIRILEGPIAPIEFEKEDNTAQKRLWKKVRDAIAEVLDNTTLADLIRNSSDDDQDEYMFYI